MSLEASYRWLCATGLDLISALKKREQQVRDQDQDHEPRGYRELALCSWSRSDLG